MLSTRAHECSARLLLRGPRRRVARLRVWAVLRGRLGVAIRRRVAIRLGAVRLRGVLRVGGRRRGRAVRLLGGISVLLGGCLRSHDVSHAQQRCEGSSNAAAPAPGGSRSGLRRLACHKRPALRAASPARRRTRRSLRRLRGPCCRPCRASRPTAGEASTKQSAHAAHTPAALARRRYGCAAGEQRRAFVPSSGGQRRTRARHAPASSGRCCGWQTCSATHAGDGRRSPCRPACAQHGVSARTGLATRRLERVARRRFGTSKACVTVWHGHAL